MEGKFDITGMLFENFQNKLVARLGKNFFKALVIQKTHIKVGIFITNVLRL